MCVGNTVTSTQGLQELLTDSEWVEHAARDRRGGVSAANMPHSRNVNDM